MLVQGGERHSIHQRPHQQQPRPGSASPLGGLAGSPAAAVAPCAGEVGVPGEGGSSRSNPLAPLRWYWAPRTRRRRPGRRRPGWRRCRRCEQMALRLLTNLVRPVPVAGALRWTPLRVSADLSQDWQSSRTTWFAHFSSGWARSSRLEPTSALARDDRLVPSPARFRAADVNDAGPAEITRLHPDSCDRASSAKFAGICNRHAGPTGRARRAHRCLPSSPPSSSPSR